MVDMTDCCRPGGAEVDTLFRPCDEKDNLLEWRPKRMERSELSAKLDSRQGEYYVLKNNRHNTYMMIGDLEVFVWNLLDDEHSVRDIIEAYYQQSGVVDYDRIVHFIKMLDARSMIDRGNDTGERKRPEDNGVFSQYKNLAAMFVQSKFSFRNVDGHLSKLYNCGVWIFYSKPIVISSLLVILFGFVIFLGQLGDTRYPLLAVNGSHFLGLATLAFWGTVILFIHECAHAFTLKHYERKVPEWGVMIYYGTFVPFTNTSDAWMLPKWPRIMVSLAGPYVTLFLGSLAAIITFISPSELIASLFFKLSFISFTSVFFNLSPLMEFDGYYALMDYLEIPNLRKKAFRFWRKELFNKAKRPARLTREEIFLGVYGGLAGGWTLLTLCFAIFTWFRRIDAYLFRSLDIYTKLAVISLILVSPLIWHIIKKYHASGSEK